MKVLTQANIVFSFFYLMFFGLLSVSGVGLMWNKGVSFERMLATIFCAGLTVIYIIRILRIKQKLMLQAAKSELGTAAEDQKHEDAV